jgi:hypothetical protein
MRLIRAARLSSARITIQGAAADGVRANISSRAIVYSAQCLTATASIGLIFHCFSGSW